METYRPHNLNIYVSIDEESCLLVKKTSYLSLGIVSSGKASSIESCFHPFVGRVNTLLLPGS